MKRQEDLFAKIARLKKERNAVILAHYYQDPDIQDVADFIGDSLQLSQQAAATQADVIVFAGVHFMAETAKILNPGRTVLLPDLEAGCSLADSCPVDAFREFKKQHPGHVVVSYINCTAEVKAESDYICTSSNAVKIVNSIPKDKKIIFAPDKNLGAWVMKQTAREMVLWQGACVVHESFSEKKLIQLQTVYPSAQVIAHPECEAPVLARASFIGSTTALLNYAIKSENKEFIVVTESGILHQMQKSAPHKTFIPSPPNANCACNECPYMRRNTLEKVALCLETLEPKIEVPGDLRD
ncbi:MAG: quinolinate synthase NadA, partial [Bdellovibrionota bacterium]